MTPAVAETRTCPSGRMRRHTRQNMGKASRLTSRRLPMLQCPVIDEQWIVVAHLIPPHGRQGWGRPARDRRMILDAILWVTINGERWHRLPRSFGPPQTAYMKWLQWRRSGVMDKILALLSAGGDGLG
ncbi:transposase [Paraburkholderia sp. JHI2823]|uniref:transposase n=1 Tax=Paraburkholderia sp. JHI2823 TaxID=3112960 RepID=UPI0031789791